MNYKSSIALTITILLSLSQVSCNIISSLADSSANQNSVSLTNPQVGQESRYLRFFHECLFCEILAPREFQPDTLVLLVIAVEENSLVLAEFISPGSKSHRNEQHAESKGVYYPDEPNDYRITIVGDTIKFSEYTRGKLGSRLSDFQDMSPIGSEDELFNLDDWKIYGSDNSRQGIAVGFSQQGNNYDTLKVTVDFSATAYDGAGYGFLYSLNEYVVLSYEYNPWINSTHGWAKMY